MAGADAHPLVLRTSPFFRSSVESFTGCSLSNLIFEVRGSNFLGVSGIFTALCWRRKNRSFFVSLFPLSRPLSHISGRTEYFASGLFLGSIALRNGSPVVWAVGNGQWAVGLDYGKPLEPRTLPVCQRHWTGALPHTRGIHVSTRIRNRNRHRPPLTHLQTQYSVNNME